MSGVYRVYIAEDEPLARQALVKMFECMPGWIATGCADNGRQALTDCLADPPDVLVTDIRMPLRDGLELAAALRQAQPQLQVVFITAHDRHAVAAFRLAAVDYLLKPVTDQDFRNCVDRVAESLRRQRTLQRLDATGAPLDVLLRERRDSVRHLVVRSIGRVDIVPVDEIVALRADGNYVDVVTAARTYVHRETMKSLSARLDPARFAQTHRSTIIAIAHLRGIERGASGARAVLADGSTTPIAARYLAALERLLAR
jgi:two-component system LytT family response regulator